MMADRELLQRYAGKGDAEAFAELVRGYQALVHATCRRGLYCQDDLDDAVQETFLRLARKAGEIRSNLGAWLHRCAVNVAVDLNRRRQTRQRYETAVGVAADAAGPEQREMVELREQVDAALAKLEEEQRELIIQRYFVGRAMADLARQQGVTPSAMTYRLEKAVAALRAELEAIGCAGAAGVGTVAAMLESEGGIQVPPALTANVMKIGLKGIGVAGAGMFGVLGVKTGIAAAVLVAATVWAVTQLGMGPAPVAHRATSRPAGPVALVEQGPTVAAPKWDAAAVATQAVLSGRVTDEAGKPVAGATVRLLGGRAMQTSTTDKDGNYAFATIAQDGEYEIEVGARGFVKRTSSGPRPDDSITLKLSKTAEARRDVVLERGVAVVVNVLDAQGNPASGARVEMASQEPIRQIHNVIYWSQNTGKDGMATETLPPGKAYVVAAVADKMAPVHQNITLEKAGDVAEVELVLGPGREVHGVVVCSDGKPAAGYEVGLHPTWWNAGRSPSWGQVKVSGKGEFVLPASEGENNVYLYDEHMGRFIGKIQVPTEEKVVQLKAPFISRGALVSIRGQVRLNGKRPDGSIMVYAERLGEMLKVHGSVEFGPGDPQVGRYEIKGLAPGEYVISFSPSEITAGRLDPVKAPGEAPLVELTVQGKTRLSGQVVDAATGKPLTQFAVRLSWRDRAWTQVAHGEGRFSLDLPAPGRYQVQVSAAGYARTWTESLNVEAGTEAQVVVKMVAGGSLTGRVVDDVGKPVAGAKVMAYSRARGERPTAMFRDTGVETVSTDEQGVFALPNLQPGLVDVEATHPDLVARVVHATVVDGQSVDAGKLVLSTGGTIVGTVYGRDGRPAAGVRVAVSDDDVDPRPVEVMTDEEGRYRVTHRPDRPAGVTVYHGDSLYVRRVVRPTDGRTIRVDFAGTPAVVSGRLLDADVAIAGREVVLASTALRYGYIRATGKTDGQGGFVFLGVPQGQYTLSFAAETGQGMDVPVREVSVGDTAVPLADVKVDCAKVELVITADEQADLERVEHAAVAEGPQRSWVIQKADGAWRAVVAANEFRLRAVCKVENATLIHTMQCQRPAGQRAMQATMRLPTRNALLRIPARVEGEDRPFGAWFQSEDESVFVATSLEGKEEKTIRLPPGKYFVRDTTTDRRDERIAPFVLEEGKVTVAPAAALVPTPRCATVRVTVWSAEGLGIEDARPRVFGADGAELPRDERWTNRWVWNLPVGTYQAKVEANGKTISREVIVTEALVASEEPTTDVELVVGR